MVVEGGLRRLPGHKLGARRSLAATGALGRGNGGAGLCSDRRWNVTVLGPYFTAQMAELTALLA